MQNFQKTKERLNSTYQLNVGKFRYEITTEKVDGIVRTINMGIHYDNVYVGGISRDMNYVSTNLIIGHDLTEHYALFQQFCEEHCPSPQQGHTDWSPAPEDEIEEE